MEVDDEKDCMNYMLGKPWLKTRYREKLNTIATWMNRLRKEKPGAKVSIWLSTILSADLNLPMKTKPNEAMTVQILLVGTGFAPTLLILCKKDRHGPQGTVHMFTIEMAQKLKLSLMNYCHCDFALIRFTLDEDCVTVENLERAYRTELKEAWSYNRSRQRLDEATFNQVKEAIITHSAMSPVPSYFEDPKNSEESLLVLDGDWRKVLYLVMEALMQKGDDSCRFTSQTDGVDFKIKVALLEAARRLSYFHEVEIRTTDKTVKQCAERINKDTKGIRPLNIIEPSSEEEKKSNADAFVLRLKIPELSDVGTRKTSVSPSDTVSARGILRADEKPKRERSLSYRIAKTPCAAHAGKRQVHSAPSHSPSVSIAC